MIKGTLSLNDGFYVTEQFDKIEQATEWAASLQRTLWLKKIIWSRWIKENNSSRCPFYKDGRPFGELKLENI